MAVSPQSLPAIDRTQPLRHLDSSPKATAADQASDSADGSAENNTVYVSFDADGSDLVPPDSVRGLIENDTHSTAIRHAPSAAPATASEQPALVGIQALELAAQRAEIARQERELDEIQRALRLREGWLADLRKELKAAQDEKRTLSSQLAEARSTLEEMSARVEKQAAQIAALEAQLADRMSLTAFASSDAPRTRPAAPSEPVNVENPATLMPLDDDSAAIVLDRKVMTVGRTRDNDICVPSVLVSRDHARLLVSDENVVLFDVGSINGSFVNEQPVKRHTLRDGDVVRFADRRYRYCG